MKKIATRLAKPPAAEKALAMDTLRESGDGVAAVERALSIVAALESSERPMPLAELATRTGFYKSTILRLLGSLIPTGLCHASARRDL